MQEAEGGCDAWPVDELLGLLEERAGGTTVSGKVPFRDCGVE